MIRITEINDNELPIRVQLGHLHAAGKTHREAAFRLLSVGDLIPSRLNFEPIPMRYSSAANWLFWNYEPSEDWLTLIRLLGKDFSRQQLEEN